MEFESLASESTDLLTVTLDPYQQRAVDWLSGHFRALVVSSAGSGKTIIAAAAIQKVVRQKTRILPVRVGWPANTIEQCNQAREALEKFPGQHSGKRGVRGGGYGLELTGRVDCG